MVKYIECDAAIEVALSCTDPLEPIEVDTTVESIVWKLRKLPIADVQPVKHGRWEDSIAKYGILIHKCSVCNKYSHMAYNYCPNCGAKMKDKDDV